jgi:hypothetical protein
MHTFYANPHAFVKAVRSKPDTSRCCWSCSRSGGPLVWMNVARDLESLGLPTQGCEAGLTLCPTCLAGYVDSFNVLVDGVAPEGAYLWPARCRRPAA